MRPTLVAVVMLAALSCGGKKPEAPAPRPPEPPAVTTDASQPAVAQPRPPAPAATQPEVAPPASEGPGMDKEKLARAYQEIYCAQKKGEMDRILGIYKAHGFNTPAEFTRVWIEAAKDTDWVTKVARDVGKKCQ